MAQSATLNTHSENRLFSGLSKLPAKFWAALVRVAEENPGYKEMQRLASLDDEALARRGIRRSDIAPLVMRGRMII